MSSASPPPGDPIPRAVTAGRGPSPDPDAGLDVTDLRFARRAGCATTRPGDGALAPGRQRAGTGRRRAGAASTAKVIGRTLGKAWSDSLFGMSSQAAFWCALSTAPLLLALLGMVGYVAGWFGPATIDDVHEQIMLFLNTIFNEEVANNLVGDTVDTILSNGQADVVSIGLIISLLGRVVGDVGVRRVHHHRLLPARVPPSGGRAVLRLGLYIIALAAGILVLPLLAIGPDYLPRLFPEHWRRSSPRSSATPTSRASPSA